MERKANNLDEAKKLFEENDEPVFCSKEGSDDQTCNTLEDAEVYYAD